MSPERQTRRSSLRSGQRRKSPWLKGHSCTPAQATLPRLRRAKLLAWATRLEGQADDERAPLLVCENRTTTKYWPTPPHRCLTPCGARRGRAPLKVSDTSSKCGAVGGHSRTLAQATAATPMI